ncbi:MAG: hypothetical protein R3C17_06645 [Planctomycetaceae bacterium]
MNIVYFLSNIGHPGGVLTKRVGARHRHIFNGVGTFPARQGQLSWAKPSLGNSNRARLHITRSGEFIPHMTSPHIGTLVVSDVVRARLSRFDGIEFLPVVFERLVDLKLPPLGDQSINEMLASSQATDLMNSMPDEPRYHESAPEYFYVLCPELEEVEETLSDVKLIDTMFGRYQTIHLKSKIPLSVELLRKHPMYRAHHLQYFVLSEDCFQEIAPLP